MYIFLGLYNPPRHVRYDSSLSFFLSLFYLLHLDSLLRHNPVGLIKTNGVQTSRSVKFELHKVYTCAYNSRQLMKDKLLRRFNNLSFASSVTTSQMSFINFIIVVIIAINFHNNITSILSNNHIHYCYNYHQTVFTFVKSQK